MTKAHVQQHSLTEFVIYGDHADRTASAEFERNRKALIEEGYGCWVCGDKGSAEHPLEAHHLHEWSLWPSLEPAKVLSTLRVVDPYGLTAKGGDTPIESPDDQRNLVLLCSHVKLGDVEIPGGHHRGLEAGVHDLTFPIWLAQKSVKAGLSITQAIKEVKARDAALAAPAAHPPPS